MSGFLGYLGEVESNWNKLKEVDETPKPKKKVVKEKKIVKRTVKENNEYQEFLRLQAKFEPEKSRYLKLKQKYENNDTEVVNESVKKDSETIPSNPRDHASFILDGMDDCVSSNGNVSHIAGNDSDVNFEDARGMTKQELSKLPAKSHAALLL